MNIQRIKVVSWDVDGTLYSLPAFMGRLKIHLIRGFFSLRCLSVLRDFWQLVRFKLYMDRVRHGAGEYRIGGPIAERDRIAAAQHRIYSALLPDLGLLPGVRGLLDWFTTRGIRQVVLSDYLPTGKLDALGVAESFDEVFTGEGYGHLKPASLVFQRMLADLGIEADELLHIGDRPDTDGAAADAVGYQVAIVGRDFETAADLMAALQGEE